MSVRSRLTDGDVATVLDVLRLSAAGSSVPDLAELTGLRPPVVKTALRQLRSAGGAAKTGRTDELGHKLWGAS
jgi:DNA-binding IclR family transcriptional regulator